MPLLRRLWHETIDDLDSNIDVTPFRQSLQKLASDLTNYIPRTSTPRSPKVTADTRIDVSAVVALLPYGA
jgi:hypothetical protein